MENIMTPPQPQNSYRIIIDINKAENRIDNVLLSQLKNQNDHLNLKNVSRTQFKNLFREGRILIKGQRATPSSGLAKGITCVDILGF